MKRVLFIVVLLVIAIILTGCVVFQFDIKTGKVFYASANENIDTNMVATISLPNDVFIKIAMQRKLKEAPASAIAIGRAVSDATTGGASEGIRNMTDPNRNE